MKNNNWLATRTKGIIDLPWLLRGYHMVSELITAPNIKFNSE